MLGANIPHINVSVDMSLVLQVRIAKYIPPGVVYVDDKKRDRLGCEMEENQNDW